MKRTLVFFLATKLGWLLILLLGKLTRIKVIGQEHLDGLRRQRASFIYMVWHGRILLPIYLHRREGVIALVSLHGDGEMIAQALHRLGYKTIRGSSTRGGSKAFRQMTTMLKQGAVCAIIPDGPTGPRHKLKPGAMYLSQLSGAYLLPMTFSASPKIQIHSWDRFTIMKPFSKSVVIYGEPLRIEKDADQQELDRLRTEFEQRMIQLDDKADEYFRK